MKIIIVGGGKVGSAIAAKLNDEGHSITIIDSLPGKAEHISEDLDILGITGNGSSISILSEAGIEEADVFIAVTGSDELNLLCCMFAKKSGCKNAIARVRNPNYSQELDFIKKQLDISAIINPELATAREISQLLNFPAADDIETFADGKVQLIKFKLLNEHGMNNAVLKDISGIIGKDVLICAIERGNVVTIPSGNFTLKDQDIVTILATPKRAADFFKKLNMPTRPVHSALIVGGGTIGYYLAKNLLEQNIQVRIVERDQERCEHLAELLPQATIVLGDGTDRGLLLSEGLSQTEAFVSLTNMDEENILLSLFAKNHSKAKLITKINRLEFDDILAGLDIGCTVYPKYITCDYIVQQVRALKNTTGSNVKTLYRILDNRVEALEFSVHNSSPVTNTPLSLLKLRKNLLVCCIKRNDEIIIPKGSDSIQPGDSVIIVTSDRGLHDIQDILAH